MKKKLWKGIAIGCGCLALLVVIRCVVTAGRFLYYGGTYWQSAVMEDPWLYVGMVAAAVCVAALLLLSELSAKAEKEEKHKDGCGE